MAVKIPPAQIQNLQQIEAIVAGRDEANRLFIIDGQFDTQMLAESGSSATVSQKEIFTVLVGPVFTRRQFLQANAMASLTKTSFNASGTSTSPSAATWQILGVDADWDDESGQVELRIEAQVNSAKAVVMINGFAFHVTILAVIAAA
jgi:hypothetical protein